MRGRNIAVTSENFGDLLIAGLEEAVVVREGTDRPARVSRRKLTVRKVAVVPPRAYKAREIAKVRKALAVSQPVIAEMLNVSSVARSCSSRSGVAAAREHPAGDAER